MSKTIIFCADGTWNGPGGDNDGDSAPDTLTNVLKLFRRLAGTDAPGSYGLACEQERILIGDGGRPVQIAKYVHGVGDSGNPLVRLLGGGVGVGTIARIVRGYTFLSRQYQPGDDIVLCGFSRGAYTVRALAGMIARVGLLRPELCPEEDKDAGYGAGLQAWWRYRDAAAPNSPFRVKVAELIVTLRTLFSADLPDNPWVPVNRIAAVGVWDTVGALGIPEYLDYGGRRDIFQFTDTKLSDKVANGFHALSIDDRRVDFTPTLWDADPARITQVLFTGAHSDVGGGYPRTENGLSDIPLMWMIDQFENLGVKFHRDYLVPLVPDPLATAHDPALAGTWKVRGKAARQFPAAAKLKVAQAVLDRCNKMAQADPSQSVSTYTPALPAHLVGGQPLPGVLVEPPPRNRS